MTEHEMRLKIQEYDCTYGDNPSLIHCPIYKPCMKHELEQKYKRAVEHGTDEESQKWTAIKERDEARIGCLQFQNAAIELAKQVEEAKAEEERLLEAIGYCHSTIAGVERINNELQTENNKLAGETAQAWMLRDRMKKERDEALEELKYLREHMENAGGDNWADAETHEIRSYLRSIVRGCKIKV